MVSNNNTVCGNCGSVNVLGMIEIGDSVKVKVPAFMPLDPEVWFAILEKSFNSVGITDDTIKFTYTWNSLHKLYIREAHDIVMRCKDHNLYQFLKTEIIKHFGTSKEQNVRQLLEKERLNSRKPSEYLRHLYKLAGDNFPENALESIWLKRLPQYIQTHLVAHKALTLKNKAKVADTITNVHAEAIAPIDLAIISRLDDIERRLSTILQKLPTVNFDNSSYQDSYQHRSRSQSTLRLRSWGCDIDDRKFCWFHWFYGERAKKCRKPCSFDLDQVKKNQEQ